MKNIKDITLLAFAVIGFYTIITAFTSTNQINLNKWLMEHLNLTFGRCIQEKELQLGFYNKQSGEIIGLDAQN